MSCYPPETMRALDTQRGIESAAQAEYDAAYPTHLEAIEVSELLDELGEVEGELHCAIKKGDAECIGRIVLNVRVALASSRAAWSAEMKPICTVQQAAALAIFGEALS